MDIYQRSIQSYAFDYYAAIKQQYNIIMYWWSGNTKQKNIYWSLTLFKVKGEQSMCCIDINICRHLRNNPMHFINTLPPNSILCIYGHLTSNKKKTTGVLLFSRSKVTQVCIVLHICRQLWNNHMYFFKYAAIKQHYIYVLMVIWHQTKKLRQSYSCQGQRSNKYRDIYM